MALLNFAEKYTDVSSRLTLPAANSGPYVELVFTKDGHIITHGTDYTPDFGANVRGLVKGSTGSPLEILRGNNTWAAITTTDLPMAVSVADAITNNKTTTTLLNTQQIIDYIGNQIQAADAMRFKGSVKFNSGDNTYTTETASGSVNKFPESAEIGDTYRIGTAGTYAGVTCSAGDILICIKEYSTGTSGNSSTYWTVVEANIKGYMSNSINGVSYQLYSNNQLSNPFKIFAPITGGNENQILISKGNAAPEWVNQSALIAGDITETAKKALLTAVSVDSTGKVSVTVGGITKTSSAASGTWGISISGQAGSVKSALSTGVGLTMGVTGSTPNTYNGSTTRTIQLVAATNSTLGGVIVGDNISLDAGTISVTKQNIIDALGYTPGNAANTSLYYLYLGASGATSNATTAVTNPYINLHGTSGGDTAIQVSGSGTITASGVNGKITIGLGAATASNYGGIKIGYTTSGKNYAVQLSDGKAYVNVPWSNTTYSIVSTEVNGLAPKIVKETITIAQTFYVLASSDGSAAPSWYKLPTNAFNNTNTWRAIKVGGTQLKGTATTTGAINFVGSGKTTVTGSGDNITINSTWRDITIGGTSIGDQKLNFIPSGDVYLKTDSNADGVTDISFGLSWYNINTGDYETA